MKQICPASALKTAAQLVTDDPIADAPWGTVIQLFPSKSIVDTVDTQTALAALFRIPANSGELQQHQFRRQKALQDAVIAFSQAAPTTIKPIVPLWSLPQQAMQQQKQSGGQNPVIPGYQEAQLKRQIAELEAKRTAPNRTF